MTNTKYIAITKEWFDKANGNSYFSTRIEDIQNDRMFILPFQYGYGSQSEYEAKRVLECYGIPVVEERIVFSLKEALGAASAMGYPVVLKGCRWDIQHKTDHGLIHLNLTDEAGVKEAFRLINDAEAGIPVLTVFEKISVGCIVNDFEAGGQIYSYIIRANKRHRQHIILCNQCQLKSEKNIVQKMHSYQEGGYIH